MTESAERQVRVPKARMSKQVTIENLKVMGKEGTHLRLFLSQNESQMYEAVAFGMGALASELKVGDKIDVAYIIDENTWNGQTKLQLKVKDIKKDERVIIKKWR